MKRITFGFANRKKSMVNDFLEKNKEENSTLNIEHFYNMDLSILNENIDNSKREKILIHYNNVVDDLFHNFEMSPPKWVTTPMVNPTSNLFYYDIEDEYLSKMRKLPGGEIIKMFYKHYQDNNKFPLKDLVLINTDGYKNKLLEFIENLKDEDLEIEILNFIKWLYYMSFNTIYHNKNLSLLKFESYK